MLQTLQIGSTSALKDLDHQVGIDHTDHLSDAFNISRERVQKVQG